VSSVVTSMLVWGDRHLPPHAIMDQARTIAATGVVDELTLPDHMSNFVPPSLWTVETTPMAAVLSDPDSLHDAYVMGALAHAAAPELSMSFATDAIRRPPAEMCQTMMSLANVLEGRARFFFGAGEAKQCRSFGHKRAQGLARQEDLLRIFDALWRADGPISHVGNHWEMKNAFLGAERSYKPEIWCMGTGPKQLELATTYCDGISSTSPGTWISPEHAGVEIERIQGLVAAKDRDPAAVAFGNFLPLIVHDDPDVVDRVLDNQIARWIGGIIGRLNPGEWRKEGIEPATPEGWTYYMRFAPYLTDPTFVEEVLSKVTRRMVELSFIYGSPPEVADEIQRYVDAGVTWVCLADFTALALDPEDAARQPGRTIDVAARLKGNT
jgi:phthiodiolone/phenolphthiodiolone dimycocerosates ketoreductase